MRKTDIVPSFEQLNAMSFMIFNARIVPACPNNSLRKELDGIPFAKALIAQIARKHIIYTPSIKHREVDKLLSGKVLSATSKPALLLAKGTGVSENK